jgi:hypothetical protein
MPAHNELSLAITNIDGSQARSAIARPYYICYKESRLLLYCLKSGLSRNILKNENHKSFYFVQIRMLLLTASASNV